jgi:hypothetical protein
VSRALRGARDIGPPSNQFTHQPKEVITLTHNELARLLPRVEIDREAIEEAWKALGRINRCSDCRDDATVLLLFLSARIVEYARAEIENRHLEDELTSSRERAANLLAAIRAALSAEGDGEGDSLWFLRDEYAAHTNPAPRDERGRGD